MRRWNVLVVVVVLALSGLQTGCNDTPPVRVYAPAVSAADFAGTSSLPDDGYQIIDSSSTVGRFPATIGVLRLAHDGSLAPAALLTAEEGEWVETFRGVTPVRDLAFLTTITLRSYEDTLAGRCMAAKGLGANLLVVYTPLRTGTNSAQVAGVIYDTASQTVIAAVQQRERVTTIGGVEAPPEEVFEEQEDFADDTDAPDPPDFRDSDALFPARAAFLKSVRTAIMQLSRNDTPAPRESTHQWSRVRLPAANELEAEAKALVNERRLTR